ncbi:MAG TPA: 2Fe-2S iron-sulfur cluster-binding protein, partial [Actinomycetes bacterium]|nr:2Fe-2S iron-sulfur cluster-binding protein [Actinomycetes bacterium]
MRLGPQPGEVIDRRRPISFTWNGASHPAYAGDTIVSALAARGERVFSRSFKYHRPRGLLTASHLDPGCLVQVGDEPNVRGAHRRVEAGMAVRAQNAWPSLRLDAKAVNRLLGRFLPAGFYYKTFIVPQRLWPLYERVLRRFAAGGVVAAGSPDGRFDKRYAHPEVVVAGGGPAGMAAAVAAAGAGARVLLVEEEHELGGHLRWGNLADLAALAELRAAVERSGGIEVMTDSAVIGRYDGNWVAVLQRGLSLVEERLVKARAGTLVVAPGLIERPYVVGGNDLPGVILSTAARRLVNLWAVRPGNRAVVLTANASGDAAVADLERAGVEVARVVDARRGGDVVRVRGGSGVRSVECDDGARIECDLVVTAVGWTSPTALLNMAGDRPVWSHAAARFLPSRLPDDVLATGGVVGDGTLEQLLAHARATGLQAARRALRTRARRGGGRATAEREPAEEPAEEPVQLPELPIAEHPPLFQARTHGFVDFSEDVTSKDLVTACREGYDSIELAKRYTTVTMGAAQGKLEAVNAVAIVAAETDRGIPETGTTVWRPPYAPVTLGALAGRVLEPVRVSP